MRPLSAIELDRDLAAASGALDNRDFAEGIRANVAEVRRRVCGRRDSSMNLERNVQRDQHP